MEKKSKAIEENKQKSTIKRLENSVYIGNLRTKTNLPPPTLTPVIVFLIAEKLLSIWL